MTTRVGVLSWDWRQQPDIATLRRILAELATLGVVEVETGSDEHAILITERALSADEQATAWQQHLDGGDTMIRLPDGPVIP